MAPTRPVRRPAFPGPYAHLEQYVFAHGLAAPADVTVVEGDPVELVRKLKAEDGLGIYLAGGGNLAGQLRDEIDEWVVKVSPVVLGAGIRVFEHAFAPGNGSRWSAPSRCRVAWWCSATAGTRDDLAAPPC